jgi:hypothetical protein
VGEKDKEVGMGSVVKEEFSVYCHCPCDFDILIPQVLLDILKENKFLY